jgi:hypothetical protein
MQDRSADPDPEGGSGSESEIRVKYSSDIGLSGQG